MKSLTHRKRSARGLIYLICGLCLTGMAAAQGFQQIVLTGDASAAFGIAAGDLDGDGDLDAATTNYSAGTALWLETLANGPGTSHAIDVAYGRLRGIGAGDLDSDGDMDLAIACYDEGRFVWLENGRGQGVDTFWVHTLRDSVSGPWSTLVADVDEDGGADLVTLEYLSNVVRIFIQANGVLTETAAFSITHPLDAVVADYDNDGDLDVVVGAYNSNIVWIEQSATGWTRHELNIGYGISSIAAADLDNDGDVDLLGTAFTINSQVTWWERTSGGGFTPHALTGDLSYPRDIGVADFDNDGDPDIVATSQNGLLRWWEHQASGFTLRQTPDGFSQYSLMIVDYDQDGDPDVLTADQGGQRILFYQNTMGIPSVVNGTVRSASGDQPVAGMGVRLVETGTMATTDGFGHYVLHAAAGNYSIETRHPCWNSALVTSVQAMSGDTTTVDISVTRPLLDLATSSLNLIVHNQTETSTPLLLTNNGDGPLTVAAQVSGSHADEWLSVDPESTTVAPGASFSFTVHVSPDTSNSQNWDYIGQIELQTNACPDSQVSVAIVVYVLDALHPQDGLPTEIALDEIYPNPFNANAVVRYALPAAQDVLIELYDISGRRINTLVHGRQSAGEHQISLKGDRLPSGLYFVELRAGETRVTRKALLVK